MKMCPDCGYICNESDLICPNCGEKFEQKNVNTNTNKTLSGRIWSEDTTIGWATVLTVAIIVGAFYLLYCVTGITIGDIFESIGDTVSDYYDMF